ncbi:MAG: M56 family metallopeptidase [Bacteroidota bacterium]
MITTIGWTLLHSLWQITFLVALYWLAKNVGKGKRALSQYYLGLITLVATWLAPILTFAYLYEANTTMVTDNFSTTPTGDITPLIFIETPTLLANEASTSWLYLLTNLLPYLVSFWGLGVMYFLGRFLWGMNKVNSLRKTENELIGSEWFQKIAQFKQQLGIQKDVRVYLSNYCKEPITFGHFKPVVLLPISLVTGFDAKAIETILLHELAHIKRHDYLVNLFQSVVEIILFYHPLVWWLSNDIRKHREHCCDDLVLSMGNNRTTYVETLTALQWRKIGAPKYQLSLSAMGQERQFSTRIKRMFGVEERPISFRQLMGAFVLLLIPAASVVAYQYYDLDRFFNKKEGTELSSDITKKVILLDENFSRQTAQRKNEELIPLDIFEFVMYGEGDNYDAIWGTYRAEKGQLIDFRVDDLIATPLMITYAGGLVYDFRVLFNSLNASQMDKESYTLTIHDRMDKQVFWKRMKEFQGRARVKVIFYELGNMGIPSETYLTGKIRGNIRPSDRSGIYRDFEIHDLSKYNLTLRANENVIFKPQYTEATSNKTVSGSSKQPFDIAEFWISHKTSKADLASWAQKATEYGALFNYESSIFKANGELDVLIGKWNARSGFTEEFYITNMDQMRVQMRVKADHVFPPTIIPNDGVDSEDLRNAMKKKILNGQNVYQGVSAETAIRLDAIDRMRIVKTPDKMNRISFDKKLSLEEQRAKMIAENEELREHLAKMELELKMKLAEANARIGLEREQYLKQLNDIKLFREAAPETFSSGDKAHMIPPYDNNVSSYGATAVLPDKE